MEVRVVHHACKLRGILVLQRIMVPWYSIVATSYLEGVSSIGQGVVKPSSPVHAPKGYQQIPASESLVTMAIYNLLA